MPHLADRVKETTTSTGTGAITTSGTAPTGFQTLAAALGSSPVGNVCYSIVNNTTGEWETGCGTFNGTTGLTRDMVRGSSNGNALVSFAAGTKDVFVTAVSGQLAHGSLGHQYANSRGCAMP